MEEGAKGIPLVALAQDESEKANANKSTESSQCLRGLVALVCFLISCSTGVVLAGSYLVKPVQRACPEWKESTTVIGEAVMMSVIGLAAIPQGELVHYWSSRTFFFTGMLLYAMGFGMGGIAVATCENGTDLTRAFYILSFAVLGVSSGFPFPACIDLLLFYFPRRPKGGIGFVCTGMSIGIILFDQFFLAMKKLADSDVIDTSTIFFTAGTLGIMISIPGLCLPRRASKRARNSETKPVTLFFTKTYYLLVFIRTSFMLPGFGLLSRQDAFLTDLWPKETPLASLAAIAQISYLASQIVAMLLVDKFAPSTLLICFSALQALCLAFMPLLLGSQYIGVAVYSLFSFSFGFQKPMGGAIAAEIYGVEVASKGALQLTVAYSLAGLFGPLIMQAMHSHWNDFKHFIYFSQGLVLVGYLSLVALFSYRTRKSS
ncbi:L-lactate transporter-like [Oscarella lobularis]|uniref:L-lactate transporter-like n=1 Tax=Oscarella lobularis TaxID=121494 RepID=UPI003313E31E